MAGSTSAFTSGSSLRSLSKHSHCMLFANQALVSLSKSAQDTTVGAVLAGVKEVLDYRNKIKLSDNSTAEAKAMANVAANLSASVKSVLDVPLSALSQPGAPSETV